MNKRGADHNQIGVCVDDATYAAIRGRADALAVNGEPRSSASMARALIMTALGLIDETTPTEHSSRKPVDRPCTKCGLVLPRSAYGWHPIGSNDPLRSSACKECLARDQRERRAVTRRRIGR
ncbi:MAG: hypothetical protein OXE50_02235 [Chloroflexi bacterium]|nr:hypothetical protein [Chloroflexota bacterium]